MKVPERGMNNLDVFILFVACRNFLDIFFGALYNISVVAAATVTV